MAKSLQEEHPSDGGSATGGVPPAGQELRPPRPKMNLLTGCALAAGIAGLLAYVLFVALMYSGTQNFELNMGEAEQQIRDQIAQDYPDFTVERVYGDRGGGLVGGGATFDVVLKWNGPEDFRLRLSYYRGSGSAPDGWLEREDVLQDRERAQEFIQAFKREHPEPGMVVAVIKYGLTVSEIQRWRSEGCTLEVDWWSLRQLEWIHRTEMLRNLLFDGYRFEELFGSTQREQWTATWSDERITWKWDGPL